MGNTACCNGNEQELDLNLGPDDVSSPTIRIFTKLAISTCIQKPRPHSKV
jgi:hypothetical protein